MNHIKQIAAKLDEYALDAMLVTSETGERYAVDFHGEGLALISKTDCWYFTDSRYIEAAQKQITGAQIACVGGGRSHRDLAAQVVREHGLERVGFESDCMSVDALERYQQGLDCALIAAPGLITGLRGAKDEQELARMKRAQEITDKAFSNILEVIRPGMTEREVAARLVYDMMCLGAEKASFDPIAAAGANGSMPHAVPGNTVIENGMFLPMDFGCVYEGYCSDMTRTVAVGQPTEEMRRVYDTVLQAQLAGLAAARAGVTGREVDQAARSVIEQAGYGAYFGHSLGHSLGLAVHESPNFSPSEQRVMPVGAVVSCEPGIYLPGRFGVRIEDVVVLTQTGCEILTASPKQLIIL
ncbi:MAG: aminopeptidase P family protein [Oscillospiraceae bacterium]|nr:aminopeptidase P family protein [Oscillospiraceae bacterium]